MGALSACMFVYYACSTRGGQNGALDPLGLEVQTVMCCGVGARNQT